LTTNIVKMPEEDEQLFGLFADWLFEDYNTPSHDSKDHHTVDAVITDLANLSVFSDRLGAVALQKDALKKLFTAWLVSGACPPTPQHPAAALVL
jgi:hypothetical protein